MRTAPYFLLTTLILGLHITLGFQSFESAQAADSGRLYQTRCAACHGIDGVGLATMGVPSVAGQSAAYLARALNAYADGHRGTATDTYGQQMVSIAKRLTSEQKNGLAEYMADFAIKDAQLEGSVSADLANGKRYYQANCGSCHGPNAEGNDALNSPALRQLDLAYLQRQYDNYLQGIRGYHKDDKYGRQMRLIASQTQDPTLVKDILAYIVSLP